MYQLVVAAMLLAPAFGKLCANPAISQDVITFTDEKMYGNGGFTVSFDVSCNGKRVKESELYAMVNGKNVNAVPQAEDGSYQVRGKGPAAPCACFFARSRDPRGYRKGVRR